MNQNRGRGKSSTKHWLGIVAGFFAFLIAGLMGVLVIVPAVSPSAGAQVADMIRSVAGPQPVADLESVSFQIQDSINQFISAHNGGQKAISLVQANTGQNTPQRQKQASSVASTSQLAMSMPVSDVVTASPQIGWQAYGPKVNGSSVMAQALLSLDPQRPYAGIALVRIDLSKLKLHMEPGFLEPSHAANVVTAIPNLGLTPIADQSNLVAGFNGGFKAVNGHYGMMVNGVTLLPAIPGLATVAIYRDGHVQIGAWGQDIIPSADMVAFRQNCPPIIQNGQLSPQVSVDNRAIWGDTIGNKEITWRTGLGITQDGRYLIYAVGNGTTVQTLAQALQDAGAYNAMQLDINRHYAHFVTYQSSGKPNPPLRAVQLLDQMENDSTLYLVAHSRDYFYLTSQ
jgi:hypothetical protein